MCLSHSVDENFHSSRVWFLHCGVKSASATSERCPMTLMRKPLSTLTLHSFLQLMEAPLVVSRLQMLSHFGIFEQRFLYIWNLMFDKPTASLWFARFWLEWYKDANCLCLSTVSLKFTMTPRRSSPPSSPTSRPPRSSCSLVLQQSTWTWTRPPLWPGSSAASPCCCSYTGSHQWCSFRLCLQILLKNNTSHMLYFSYNYLI